MQVRTVSRGRDDDAAHSCRVAPNQAVGGLSRRRRRIHPRTTPLTQETTSSASSRAWSWAAVGEVRWPPTAKRSIWPIEQAVEALIDDDDFWAEQAHSLAIFATPEWIRTFRLPNRLTNHVEVADRFHIKPLLRAVTFPHNAYVLAIGMGAVRLVEVDADLPPHEVTVPGLPKDMASALGRRSHGERTGPAAPASRPASTRC